MPGDWATYLDARRRPYYVSAATGQRAWRLPPDAGTPDPVDHDPSEWRRVVVDDKIYFYNDRTHQSAWDAPGEVRGDAAAPPSVWCEYWSEDYDREYYYCPATKAVRWDRPQTGEIKTEIQAFRDAGHVVFVDASGAVVLEEEGDDDDEEEEEEREEGRGTDPPPETRKRRAPVAEEIGATLSSSLSAAVAAPGGSRLYDTHCGALESETDFLHYVAQRDTTPREAFELWAGSLPAASTTTTPKQSMKALKSAIRKALKAHPAATSLDALPNGAVPDDALAAVGSRVAADLAFDAVRAKLLKVPK